MIDLEQNKQKLFAFLDRCPCAICGARPVTVREVFTPDEILQHLYGAPAGMTRTFFYGLCAKCFCRGPDYVVPQVEAAAMADCGRNI